MAKIDDSVKLTSFKGNLYDVMKLILAKRGVSVGRARNPLPHVEDDEMDHVEVVRQHIDDAIAEFTKWQIARNNLNKFSNADYAKRSQ